MLTKPCTDVTEKSEVLSENHHCLEEKTEKIKNIVRSGSAPDGGWGWMVVLGCTYMHFLVGGFNRSYGVLFIQLQHRFHSSAAITAWVGGMATALRMGLSKPSYTHIYIVFHLKSSILFFLLDGSCPHEQVSLLFRF